MGKYAVKLETLEKELELEVIYKPEDYEEILISVSVLTRPGLALTGFYDYFDSKRILIFGKMEWAYLCSLDEGERKMRVDALFSRHPAAMVVSNTAEVMEELKEAAERYGVPLLFTDRNTSESMSRLTTALNRHLAPRSTIHGVLVEVYGEGMLITGDSGVGKSETALELIKRGHRLIADDAVEIRSVSASRLVGAAPEMIRYYMELRGIGVVDVRHLFGIGAVKPSGSIDMVVNLIKWDENKVYDRLGLDTQYTEILGVKLPQVTIPVAPGRNLAVILELAAMNNRQKNAGYNAAEILAQHHDAAINAGGF